MIKPARMGRASVALLLLLMGLPTAMAASPVAPVPSGPGDPLADLPCTRFEWISSPGLSDRAAMKIPVRMDGHDYWFQFDSGADATILYDGDHEARRRGWRNYDERFLRVPDVRVGGGSIRMAKIFRSDQPPGEGIRGTVGLDLLVGRTTIVDFPGRRFCVLARADVPPSLLSTMVAVPVVLRDGKPFMRVKVDGREVDDLFWDSGASAMPCSSTGRSGRT